MNSISQLDFHPDAESLNAFAEKALPERERGQIVAHLAECSRCRQVIFLARQAAADLEAEAAVSAAQSAGRSGSWFSGWRLAWIPAAAVVGLAVLVHGRHEETGPEMARAVPQINPQEEGSVAKPATTERELAKKAHAPVSSADEKRPEIKIESAPAGAAYAPGSEGAASPSAAATEAATVPAAPPLLQAENTSAGQAMQAEPSNQEQIKATPLNGRNWVYIAQLTAGQNKSAASSATLPPTGSMHQRATGAYSSSVKADRAAEAKMDDMEERSQASRKAKARYADSGGAPTLQLKKEALPSSGFDAGGQMPVVQFATARQANNAALPSGLTAVSSVTAESRTLAIDQAGTLFLSNDSGSHWESVARQWSGRAVDVSLLPSLNGRSFVVAPTSGAAAAAAAPAGIFELRNDKNLIWVSTDGVIWTAQ